MNLLFLEGVGGGGGWGGWTVVILPGQPRRHQVSYTLYQPRKSMQGNSPQNWHFTNLWPENIAQRLFYCDFKLPNKFMSIWLFSSTNKRNIKIRKMFSNARYIVFIADFQKHILAQLAYGYVPHFRVWFSSCFNLKIGYGFCLFSLE